MSKKKSMPKNGRLIQDLQLGLEAKVIDLLSVQFAAVVTKVPSKRGFHMPGDVVMYFYKDEGTEWRNA